MDVWEYIEKYINEISKLEEKLDIAKIDAKNRVIRLSNIIQQRKFDKPQECKISKIDNYLISDIDVKFDEMEFAIEGSGARKLKLKLAGEVVDILQPLEVVISAHRHISFHTILIKELVSKKLDIEYLIEEYEKATSKNTKENQS